MRIWFNRGFSLAPIAAAMRAADPGVEVFISTSHGRRQYEGPTDTWFDSEDDAPQYVDWAHESIQANNIDLFIPTRHRDAIARADLPCRVEMPAIPAVLQLLADKYAFANSIAQEPFHLPTRLIGSSAALARAIESFPESDEAIPCIKPRNGVNGIGFWKLTRTNPLSHLNDPDARDIRADLYVDALKAQEAVAPIDDLVLMDYLPGPEISFDILAHRGNLLKYAARTKLANGNQKIETEHPLSTSIAKLVTRFDLHGIVNAQFRRARDGCWKLLEINTRPAGGIIYSEQVGCRLIADWTRILTGKATASSISRIPIDTEISFSNSVREVDGTS